MTRLAAFLDGLAAGLAARPALAGVAVWTGAVDPQDEGRAAIVLGATVECDEVQPTPSTWVEEALRTTAELRLVTVGSGEEDIAAARSEALALLDELRAELAERPGGVASAVVDGWRLEQLPGPQPGTREVRLSARLLVRAAYEG